MKTTRKYLQTLIEEHPGNPDPDDRSIMQPPGWAFDQARDEFLAFFDDEELGDHVNAMLVRSHEIRQEEESRA